MEDAPGKKKKGKSEPEPVPVGNEDFKSMSLEELQKLLSEVVDQEDYIRAIAIRNEIENRKKR